jgi:D-glycero-D-manno-heptose 1,7-bisphosphate phosphatase
MPSTMPSSRDLPPADRVRPAVFLDRDGTMIHESGYLSRLPDLRWFPWTVDAVRLLNRAGFLVCVTTNQSGIGFGFYTEKFVVDVHSRMEATLEAGGARVDGWFFCPHHPSALVDKWRTDCDCRKPKDGMIRQAAARLGIDPHRSFVVGDKLSDVGLATSAGARGVLVRTGYGDDVVRAHAAGVPGAAHVAADLMEATAWLLAESGHPRHET